MSIREKYHIPANGKVLLYVGNISANKNQQQLVESYELLPASVKENTWVLFCGRPSKDGSFEDFVKQRSDNAHLILCGVIKKEDMPYYFCEADGVILLSYAEGFGLSLIEGLHFGIPFMTFNDLDAFDDIYDDKVAIEVKERNNDAVARGVIMLLTNTWDKELIKNYSRKFEASVMADNYIKVYKSILSV